MLPFLFISFLVVIFIQFFYYIVVFGKFAFVNPKSNHPKKLSVSVIVCAKNEFENVKKFIPILAAQDYPDFEIVLIDDASSDETLDVFEIFEKQFSNIRLVKVANNEAFWGNKKFALTLGIKAAQKEYLLFTDADCYPTSVNWISEMTSQFSFQKTIVLGYGGYEKIPNSFLNKIIRFETILTAIQYFSWARFGKPYMGVGRNLAYKKSEFFRVDGFKSHLQIRSGDDDLFINQVATQKNTAVCLSPESFTYSVPKTTFKEWFAQKRRHISTANHYKSFDRMQLTLFYASQWLFLMLALLLLCFDYLPFAVLILSIIRYAFVITTIGFSATKLKEKDLIVWFPILEIILIWSQMNILVTNFFSKPKNWK